MLNQVYRGSAEHEVMHTMQEKIVGHPFEPAVNSLACTQIRHSTKGKLAQP